MFVGIEGGKDKELVCAKAKQAAESMGFRKINETVYDGQAVLSGEMTSLPETSMGTTGVLGKWPAPSKHLVV